METSRQWQLAQHAATTYARVVVPTILGPFAGVLVDWAQLQAGETVLDVGCGTGAATLLAARAVGATGHVIGSDVNASMIAVAQELPPARGAPITWKQQSVYDLNPADAVVDVVMSAQVAQFFPDKSRAFTAMRHMLKPGGRLVLSTWCAAEENPYFRAQIDAVIRHLGSEPVGGFAAGLSLADPDQLHTLLAAAGFTAIKVEVAQRDLPLPPLATFIPEHFQATPLAAAFAAASVNQQQAITNDIIMALASYQQASGAVIVPFRSYVARGFV